MRLKNSRCNVSFSCITVPAYRDITYVSRRREKISETSVSSLVGVTGCHPSHSVVESQLAGLPENGPLEAA